ncbi:MAG: hypothetical protein GY851_24940, partial [bacterium]|nr:hypothetical protein [bacterium]
SVGAHTVSYNSVAGWNTPSDESVTITNGQLTMATGTCVNLMGSLTVTLEPEAARTAGAQWRVGSGAWQSSGDTVTELSEGQHTVSFCTLDGWEAPTEETVTITADATTSTTGTYTEVSELSLHIAMALAFVLLATGAILLAQRRRA